MKKDFTEQELNEIIKVYLENKYAYEFWVKHDGVACVDIWCTHSDSDYLNPEFMFYILSEFVKWLERTVKVRK